MGHTQQLGSLPVALVPLPAPSPAASAASLASAASIASGRGLLALALGERPFLVRRHSSSGGGGGGGGRTGGGGGRPTAEPLCAAQLARATPLTLHGDSPQ